MYFKSFFERIDIYWQPYYASRSIMRMSLLKFRFHTIAVQITILFYIHLLTNIPF